jgi:hypothetical protein
MKKNTRRAGTLVAACGLAVLLMASSARAVIDIDHFEQGFVDDVTAGSVLIVGNGLGGNAPTTASSTQTGLVTVYGGNRKATLTWVSGDGTISAEAENVIVPPNHFLEVNNGANDRSVMTLVYDGDAGTGNLGDLTDGGLATRLVLTQLRADINASITVTFEDSGGSVDSVTHLVLVPVTPPGIVLSFLFSDYDASVDFTDIDKLTVTLTDVNATDAVDFQIDGITVLDRPPEGIIPEPVTMLGMVLGLGGVGAYLRRRRTA